MPHTRPTTEIAKEGLFNILQNNLEIDELKVLDLFGGTGCISYELASRGAPEISIVEKDDKMYAFIKKTFCPEYWFCPVIVPADQLNADVPIPLDNESTKNNDILTLSSSGKDTGVYPLAAAGTNALKSKDLVKLVLHLSLNVFC